MIEAAYCEDGNSDKAEWKQLVAETKLSLMPSMHEAEDIDVNYDTAEYLS